MGRSKLEIIKDKKGNIFFDNDYKFKYGKSNLLRDGSDAALFVMGTLTGKAVKIVDRLTDQGITLQVWNVSCPVDLDEDALKKAAQTGTIFTYEDHNVNTGLGSSIADKMMQLGLYCKFHKFGVEDYSFSGKSSDLFQFYGLDVNSMVDNIKHIL